MLLMKGGGPVGWIGMAVWELELLLLVDADSGHRSFTFSWMHHSYFVAAVGRNKKSPHAVAFSNVSPMLLHRLISIYIRRQIKINDSNGGGPFN